MTKQEKLKRANTFKIVNALNKEAKNLIEQPQDPRPLDSLTKAVYLLLEAQNVLLNHMGVSDNSLN